jgi:serine/threonine-protein kinase RsbW
MTGNDMETAEGQLTLESRLSDLVQVAPWIERLAAQHAIPQETQFAIDLCLEEVLSNIIRHGYSGEPNHSIAVRFESPRSGYFVFIVEDKAPLFNPIDAQQPPPISADDDLQVGGQGIRLVREFADALEYQATPSGNRLRIGFNAAGSAIADD